MMIDLSTTPFSRRGSWMNLSCPQLADFQPLGPGLYLRAHHSRPLTSRELFKIELFDEAADVPFSVEAEPHCVALVDESGAKRMELFFEHADTLRLRGNCGLRFRSAFAGSADRKTAVHFSACVERPGLVTVNARPSLRRYAFEALSGRVELDAPWDGEMVAYAEVTVRPGASGHVDLAVDEFWSTWVRPERSDFDAAVARVAGEFDCFASGFPELAAEWDATGRAAAYLLWSCTQAPAGLLKREAVYMSLNWMDQVWSWDNCFNMAGLAAADPDLAFDQLLTMADHQDAFGAYPDGVNDGFKHYNFSKPPVQSILLDWAERMAPGFLDVKRTQAARDTVGKFTRWWLEHRRFEGNVLCHNYHGNDLGWDNGSLIKEGGPLIAPDVNTFLILQCEWLGNLAEAAGDASEAASWRRDADALSEAFLDTLWDGERFGAVHVPSGRLITSRGHAAFLPALLGARLPAQVRGKLLDSARELITPHGFASEAPGSPDYRPEGYWRGPVWAPVVLLAVTGLEAIGEQALALEVAENFCRTCVRSGFAENFNAETGAPLVDPAYTWTASTYLCLARSLSGAQT